jgi:polar amino acid transport system substrate-binding protein
LTSWEPAVTTMGSPRSVGKLKFSSFNDLVGHDIAVLRGAAVSPEFWNFVREHRNFSETASGEANFRMLEAGRVDYVVLSFVQGMRSRQSEVGAPAVCASISTGGRFAAYFAIS